MEPGEENNANHPGRRRQAATCQKADRLIPLPAGIRGKTVREVEASAMWHLDARAKAGQEPALRVDKGDSAGGLADSMAAVFCFFSRACPAAQPMQPAAAVTCSAWGWTPSPGTLGDRRLASAGRSKWGDCLLSCSSYFLHRASCRAALRIAATESASLFVIVVSGQPYASRNKGETYRLFAATCKSARQPQPAPLSPSPPPFHDARRLTKTSPWFCTKSVDGGGCPDVRQTTGIYLKQVFMAGLVLFFQGDTMGNTSSTLAVIHVTVFLNMFNVSHKENKENGASIWKC
jgi:hypothetical protein